MCRTAKKKRPERPSVGETAGNEEDRRWRCGVSDPLLQSPRRLERALIGSLRPFLVCFGKVDGCLGGIGVACRGEGGDVHEPFGCSEMIIRDGEWSMGGVGEGLGVMSGIAGAGCGLVDPIDPSRFRKSLQSTTPIHLHIPPLPSTIPQSPPHPSPSPPLVFPPLSSPSPTERSTGHYSIFPHTLIHYSYYGSTTVLFVYLRLHHTAPHNTT